jgi:uncharacterized protein (DUF1810 family)
MSRSDLSRFVEAQTRVIDGVEQELASGRKTSHWMWFVFPQLAGLGRSPTAQFYAIRDPGEARAYLAHPVLGARLRRHVSLLLTHSDRPPEQILGSIDALKLRSCLTLFREVSDDPADRALFDDALHALYAGVADARTEQLLGR